MIYLDTSVVLAHLLAEDRAPPTEIWQRTLVSSRLLEYELWTRIHARGLGASHREVVRLALDRIAFLELVGPVLEGAVKGFPGPIRTLDALHLASVRFLQDQGTEVRLATYDQRMAAAAGTAGIPLHPLP